MELSPRNASTGPDFVPNILSAEIIVCIAATVAVVLRVCSRTLRGISLGADDYTIILALLPAWAISGTTFAMVHFGFGRYVTDIAPEAYPSFSKALLAGEIFWAVGIPITKISICLLYRRIFGDLRYMRLATNALVLFSLFWGITYVTVLALQCIPISALWDFNIKNAHCMDAMLFCLIGSAFNVATDFILLVLPMHAVWQLQMSKQNKLQITGILLLGTFTSAISLARLICLSTWENADNLTWKFRYPYLFASIELQLGIVSACLPTLRPLVQRSYNLARNSIGHFSSQSNQDKYGEKIIVSEGSKSDTYTYQVVVSRPSKASINSTNERLFNPKDRPYSPEERLYELDERPHERLCNPNDLSFWRNEV